MQILYKLFVSEREVVKNLPFMFPRKLKEKQLDGLIKSTRKLLFFRKLKKFIAKHII